MRKFERTSMLHGNSVILNLCLRPTDLPLDDSSNAIEAAEDIVAQLLRMEASPAYQCQDYLGKRRLPPPTPRARSWRDDDEDDPEEQIDIALWSSVDAVCRERMVAWSYRVVDAFQCHRQVVAIAFAYVDRFLHVSNGCCDRTTFKLAAMTALYMATKLHDNRRISIKTLVDLSRGEFRSYDVLNMEQQLLNALEWRVNPPLAQSFLDAWIKSVPALEGLATALYQRATLFSELAVYDYTLCYQKPSMIALASLWNAWEGMVPQEVRNVDHLLDSVGEWLASLQRSVVEDDAAADLEDLRNRMWYLYTMSAQFVRDTKDQERMQQKQQQQAVVCSPRAVERNDDQQQWGKWSLGRGEQQTTSPVSVATTN